MGTLDRYQKAGGFIQLLQLIETCTPAKKEKFLLMVKEEDPRWSEAIEKKMLSMDRILAWSDEVFSEIAGSLQELTIAVAFHGLKPEQRERFFRTFNHNQKRKIEDLFEINHPSAADISAAHIKILVEVRKLMQSGVLRSDKVEAEVFVEDGIEDSLRKGAEAHVLKNILQMPEAKEVESPLRVAGDSDELKLLRKKIIALSEENNHLKHDVHNLRAKIEQIKKLAA